MIMDIELGSVIGYRGWSIGIRPGNPPILLSLNGTEWPYGTIEAACPIHGGEDRHIVPMRGCRCGIYAMTDQVRLYTSSFLIYPVVGKVELFGKVIEHQYGYRAQYARVVSLCDYTIDSTISTEIDFSRDNYQVIQLWNPKLNLYKIMLYSDFIVSMLEPDSPVYEALHGKAEFAKLVSRDKFREIISTLRTIYTME